MYIIIFMIYTIIMTRFILNITTQDVQMVQTRCIENTEFIQSSRKYWNISFVFFSIIGL